VDRVLARRRLGRVEARGDGYVEDVAVAVHAVAPVLHHQVVDPQLLGVAAQVEFESKS